MNKFIGFKTLRLVMIALFFFQMDIQGAETIRFGLVPGFRPVTFVDESGAPAGFTVELYSRIIREFDYEPEFVVGNFNTLYKQLLKNELDFFGTLTRRPDREKLFFWPEEPTHVGWGQMFVAYGSYISNIDELRGAKIGLVSNEAKGKSFVKYMSSLGIPFEKKYYANFKELINGVVDKQVFGGIANSIIVSTNAEIEPTSIVFAPTSSFSTTGINNTRMIPIVIRLNKRMKELKADPDSYYWDLYNKWFTPANIELEVIPAWLLSLVFILAGSAIVMYILSVIFKAQLRSRTEELETSQKHLNILFEQAADAIFVCDSNGFLIQANAKACQLLGYSMEELQKLHLWEIDKQFNDRDSFNDFFQSLSLAGSQIFETSYFCNDGSTFPVEVTTSYLILPSGPCLIESARDITARKQAENEKYQLERRLEQSYKMESIGNLAGGIAHDFNNLLSPIIGMSEILLLDLEKGTEEHENAFEINQAGRRAGELVKQILTFSRQSERYKTPTKIQGILKEVLKLIRSTIPSSVEIIDELNCDCGLVMADPVQIHQIAMNLVTNAYHALKGTKGIINISLDKVDYDNNSTGLKRYVSITVKDNGVGISDSVVDRIFDPYFTTKERGKGTGLGLSVVYGIVKDHGGEISVTSEVGKGSTFSVLLPVINEKEIPAQVEKVEALEKGNERILLVDDEESITKLIGRVLARLGYAVTVYHDSEEALTVFKAAPDAFDILITDMTMPKLTGDVLTQEVLAVRPDIPVIILTGYSEQMDEDKAHKIGAKGFLMKPVPTSKLASMLRRLLVNRKN